MVCARMTDGRFSKGSPMPMNTAGEKGYLLDTVMGSRYIPLGCVLMTQVDMKVCFTLDCTCQLKACC